MPMKCPACGAVTEVKETRLQKKGDVTRRTYQCYGSHKSQEIHKFVTHEKIVSVRTKDKP